MFDTAKNIIHMKKKKKKLCSEIITINCNAKTCLYHCNIFPPQKNVIDHAKNFIPLKRKGNKTVF